MQVREDAPLPVVDDEQADTDRSAQGKPRVLTTTTTRATFERLQTDSLAEYTRRIDAGVTINADNASINIRGLDADRVLTTIDGIRTFWLSDGARGVQGGAFAFDFNSLSAIDVVKNSDSSFFGTGALGGVLALRTLDPESLLGTGKTQGGLSKVTYDSVSDSVYLNQAVAVRQGDTLLLVQGGYRNGQETENKGSTGGSGSTRTRKNPAAYDQENLLVKVHQYLPGGHRLGLTGELFNRDYDENTLTSISSTYSRYRTQEETRRRRISGTWDYQGDADGLVREGHLLGYWQRNELETYTRAQRLTAPVGEYDRDSTLRMDTFGARGSLTLGGQTGPLGHELTLVGDLYASRTSQYAAGEDNCTAAIYSCAFLHVNQSDMPDVHGTDLGLAVQDRVTLGAGGWLRVTPGVRFDWFERKPQDTASYEANAAYEGLPASTRASHWSPKVLVEARVLPGVTLYGQYSQAFRAPSATELYLAYGSPSSYVSLGNPDLKPETSTGWEGGVTYGDSRKGAKLSGYYNRYRNFIDTVTTTATAAGLEGSYPYGVFEYTNRAHVRIYGFEAEAHWMVAKAVRVWGSLAYANGKDTDEAVHLNSIPPFKGVVGAGYAGAHFGADLSATLAAKRDKVEDTSSDLNKAPGYAVVDLTAWWRPSFAQGLRLGAGLYNLLDDTWYSALDLPDSGSLAKAYYSQPGRSFKLSALVNF
ncbi:TonB-dependent hemoglobin/transferrin/lactoferrin family receptor [Novosphingobium sp. 1949]|uniref:TonB-dependent hemoglobin/transferrin/lactoferrin family receptor n=1 Tax=Novosphingobium organovorum TaxID=2930092 RepID=A0ABT0BGW6_9SPHN|nr:TonB-dependent hemoglobin/transferrin/lactoferrin family receptor [Novosphingobium organovorum]MCJ2184279.1 TonB-dependent hemoglobin/transferrin/lactoferrin family receptor [Novosphingobium organovorum]